jgi:hypothetical protein
LRTRQEMTGGGGFASLFACVQKFALLSVSAK